MYIYNLEQLGLRKYCLLFFFTSILHSSLHSIWSPHPFLPPSPPPSVEGYTILTQDLQAMPITNDTLKQRSRRLALESKLAEVEDAIKIFSKTKAYIKLDDHE